jgi:Taurine catabolism dioxygenase TauD, TfdA family
MFLVHNGHDSFYAPALSGRQYRFDPGCMTACDARAREVEQYFVDQIKNAATYEWQDAGQILVIDNYRTLHARSAVAEDDLGRKLTRISFQTKSVP